MMQHLSSKENGGAQQLRGSREFFRNPANYRKSRYPENTYQKQPGRYQEPAGNDQPDMLKASANVIPRMLIISQDDQQSKDDGDGEATPILST